MKALFCLLPTMLFFSLLDQLWLGQLINPLYIKYLSYHLNIEQAQIQLQLLPTLIVYVLIAFMIWVLVIPLSKEKIELGLVYGCLMGFVIFGISNMTSLATLKHWPITITIINWCWGCIVCALSSGLCSLLAFKLFPLFMEKFSISEK